MLRAVFPFVVLVLLAGCAGTQVGTPTRHAPSTPRIAVLPSAVLAEGSEFPALDPAFGRGLAEVEGLGLVPSEATSRALADEQDRCSESIECLRDVGTELHATHVASLTAVALGDTVLVRVRLVEIAGAHGDRTRQELLRDATAERLAALLARIGEELGRELVPRRRAGPGFYTVVGIVGAGLVAATAVSVVNRGPTPDAIVRPP